MSGRAPTRMRRMAAAGGMLAVLAASTIAAAPAAAAQIAAAPAAAARLAAAPAAAAAQEECTAATRFTESVPALAELQSEAAWTRTRGAGVTVAVVDSGVAAGPHLAGAVVGGVNLVPDGTDPAGATDLYGHGTAIAGQIAARRISGSGVEGLAPEAGILSVRVFAGTSDEQVEAGWGPSTARMAEGIRYAADQGAQIINVSMSTLDADPGLADAVSYAAARGSLVVSSSGNSDASLTVEQSGGDGARYPAGFDEALGVSATGSDSVVTDASIHGPHVDLAAPGQLVLTTSAQGGDCVFAPEAPATSYAAGYVSAAAALVAAAHPDETPAQWAYRLQATAVRSDPDARDDAAGWGVVQPFDAIALVPGSAVRGPESPFPAAGSSGSDGTGAASVADPVHVTDDPGDDAEAIRIGVVTGIGGLVVLAALGALGVYVVRRHEAVTRRPPRTGRGLYGDADAADP